jgi:hypothetical protein
MKQDAINMPLVNKMKREAATPADAAVVLGDIDEKRKDRPTHKFHASGRNPIDAGLELRFWRLRPGNTCQHGGFSRGKAGQDRARRESRGCSCVPRKQSAEGHGIGSHFKVTKPSFNCLS